MRTITIAVLIVVGCLALPSPSAGQALGTIAGAVKDTSGALLPGVTVEASSPALIEKTRSAVTNGAGQYSIVNLPPGIYTVKFEQFDPDNPSNEFRYSTSSSFIVFLDRKPGVMDAESQFIFHNFGRNGETQKTLPGGPFYVDVTNADHSYVVRLTPQ